MTLRKLKNLSSMISGLSKTEHVITESKWHTLTLSPKDSEALWILRDKWRTATVDWFGKKPKEEDTVKDGGKVIDVKHIRNGDIQVKVLDAIGAIDLPESVIIVAPKIPIAHFNYIASRALSVPRVYKGNFGLQQGNNFLELICNWAIDSIEAILRDGLIRDYKTLRAPLLTIRGRVHVAPTYLNLNRGSLAIDCEFEDHTVDTALNRVLKNALDFIGRNPGVSPLLRKRAKRASAQFSGVGKLKPQDSRAIPQRNSKHYVDALHFSNQVIMKSGVELGVGDSKARSFLYKTPLLIEEGLRRIIESGLAPVAVVKPRQMALESSTGKNVSANPDIGISKDPFLVGDIKYKIQEDYWRRPDLAQSVFFAVAYESPKSLIIDFENEKSNPNGDVKVSHILVSAIGWDARETSAPEESSAKLIDEVKAWLGRDKISFVKDLVNQ